MKPNNEIVPVEIFAGTIWQSEMVKNLLENEGIETFLKDENTGTLAPWYTAPGGAGSVKVVVSSSDFDKAKLIVSEYENNIKTND
jgi:hypothetical protein